MRWASALSLAAELESALSAAAREVRSGLRDSQADLVIAFVAKAYGSGFDSVCGRLRQEFPNAQIFGCVAQSVIGGGSEVEDRPAVALTAAFLPDVGIRAFHVEDTDLPAPEADARAWADSLGVAADGDPQFLLLGDPFSTDSERLLSGLDFAYASGVKIGGLASGGAEPGANSLFLGEARHRTGFVGLALTGNLAIDAIVAQGCRPIGTPMFITRCKGNVLLEVDGRPPLEVLNDLFVRADAREQELFRASLFVGVEMRPSESEYHRGDFLVRNIVGGDPETGALAVATELADQQVVQFHLRDRATATHDLVERVAHYPVKAASVRGALLFSCLGRGEQLFGVSNHDSELFLRHMGDVPLTGFFGNGEIGPVQGRSFLHGYTSSFAVFRARG